MDMPTARTTRSGKQRLDPYTKPDSGKSALAVEDETVKGSTDVESKDGHAEVDKDRPTAESKDDAKLEEWDSVLTMWADSILDDIS